VDRRARRLPADETGRNNEASELSRRASTTASCDRSMKPGAGSKKFDNRNFGTKPLARHAVSVQRHTEQQPPIAH
jgi:hypothetical protein